MAGARRTPWVWMVFVAVVGVVLIAAAVFVTVRITAALPRATVSIQSPTTLLVDRGAPPPIPLPARGIALGNPTRVATVAWGVLEQPWLMITGQAPIHDMTSWMYAWVVEAVTLIFALALSAAVVKISAANPHLAKWFVIFGAAMM